MNAWVNRVKKIIDHRQIVKSMVTKNLKDKYVGSALGISWTVINPLLMMLAVSFVFTQVTKTEMRHFPLMVLSALLPWFFFINSICESTNSIRSNADVLRQFVLPREIIPISIVLTDFIIFIVGFIALFPVFIIFNFSIIKYIFLLPLIMFLHFLFTLGVSMLFSVTNVYFKDLSQILNILVMFLFWMTPVFYPLHVVPENYRWVIMLNPGTCYMVLYRSLIYHASPGGIQMWSLAFLFAFVSAIIGHYLFVKNETDILKRI